MDIKKEIIQEFSLSEDNILSDEFIRENEDLMWFKEEIDHLVYVPSYMLWCLKNGEVDGNLICEYTIRSIAEYGRAKDPENIDLNFKFRCTPKQRELVCQFLTWCNATLELCDNEQINRSIKHWQ